MAHVITLTGPAHCGKSTIKKMFMEYEDMYFKPYSVSKYTTRNARKSDDDVICVKKIPAECDIVYEQYGVRYGFRLEDLYELLEEEKTPIIVINDIRAVEDIKSALGELVISIFLYRKAAMYEDFYNEEKERASQETTDKEIEECARTRYDKAQAIYRIYIENIQLFDKVILNTFDAESTKIQVNHVVRSLEKAYSGLKEKKSDV